MMKLCCTLTENGEESSKKRPRVSSGEIQGSVVRFEWEGDGGVWTAYNEDHNGTLVTSYNNLKPGDDKQQVWKLLVLIKITLLLLSGPSTTGL